MPAKELVNLMKPTVFLFTRTILAQLIAFVGLFLLAAQSQLAANPQITGINIFPKVLTPGSQFQVIVTGANLSTTAAFVDFRPHSKSRIRIPLVLNQNTQQYVGTGTVPADFNSNDPLQTLPVLIMARGQNRRTVEAFNDVQLIRIARNVLVTSPEQHQEFVAGQDILVQATPSNISGTVDKAELYVNGTKVEELNQPGAIEFTTQQPEGTYQLVVKLTNDSGTTFTSAPTTITVAPAGGGTFLSPLSLTPQAIPVDTPTPVIFGISFDPAAGGGQPLKLWRSTETGQLGDQVGELFDNGNLGIGDDVQGDGVYHGRFTMSASRPGIQYFRVTDSTGNQLSSLQNAFISFIELPSNQQVQDALDCGTNVKQVFDNAKNGGKTDQEALDIVLLALSQDPMVVEFGLSQNNLGVWWFTESGLPGVHFVFEEDQGTRGGGDSDAVADAVEQLTYDQMLAERRALIDAQTRPSSDGSPLVLPEFFPMTVNNAANTASNLSVEAVVAQNGAAAPANTPQSKDALLVRGFNFGRDELDEIQADLEALCYSVTLVDVANVTLNHFKNLNRYGVFSLVSHGDTFFQNSIFSPAEWGSNRNNSQCVIWTPIKYTSAHLIDWITGRIAVTASGNVCLTPAFIRRYNANLPNSLIYLGICRGAFNGTMANAFINRGAGSYLSFSDYVGTVWAETRGIGLFTDLRAGQTVSQSNQVGMTETDSDPATFRRFGAADHALTADGQNLGFEQGTLAGWSATGDARIIPSLRVIGPREGAYMAIISTGLGSVTRSTSTLSQKFNPTVDAPILVFCANTVSEEPLEFVGSRFNDTFNVTVNGVNTTLLESINSSAWSPLEGASVSYFSGGDDTTYETGWKAYTLDLTPYIGQCVEVTFRVFDQGDSIYDTAALIDAVTLVDPITALLNPLDK